MTELRLLTSLELFLNSVYYCKHPCTISAFEKGKDVYRSFKNLLSILVSNDSFDVCKVATDMIKQEAILNCKNKTWSGFLCVLALSSVIGRNINSFYPDCGHAKYSLLFNQKIEPRLPIVQSVDDLYILLCYEGLLPSSTDFKYNHYVPLVHGLIGNKRKLVQKKTIYL